MASIHIWGLAATVAIFLSACTPTPPTWQQEVANNGYVPLPDVALIALVDANTHKPTTRNTLLGSLVPLRQEEIAMDPKKTVYLWQDTTPNDGVDSDVRIDPATQQIAQTNVAEIKITANTKKIGDIDFDLKDNKSVSLKNLYVASINADDTPLLAKFLMIFEDPKLERYQSECWGVATSAIVGDLNESRTSGITLQATEPSTQPIVNVTLQNGRTASISTVGGVLGVKGRIMKVTAEGRSLNQSVLIPPNANTSLADEGVQIAFVGDKLMFTVSGMTPLVFSGSSTDFAKSTDGSVTPTPGFTNVLLGTLNSSYGYVVSLVFFMDSTGKLSLSSVARYSVEVKPLYYSTLVEGERNSEFATRLTVNRLAWDSEIPQNLRDDFYAQMQSDLDTVPFENELATPLCEIVELYSPPEKQGEKYHYARLLRYDVQGHDGEVLRYQAIDPNNPGGTEGQLLGEDKGRFKRLNVGRPVYFWNNEQQLVIPRGVDHIVIRYGALADTVPQDISGFFGARRSDIRSLNWTAAFIPPLGGDCYFIAGGVKPVTHLDSQGSGSLPAWAIPALEATGLDGEPELKFMDSAWKANTLPAKIYNFELQDLNRDDAWVVYTTGTE